MVGCSDKANFPHVGPGLVALSEGSQYVFLKVSAKTTENSEQLGR